MQNLINWNDFQYKNSGKETIAFEKMTYFLFCNELKIKIGIFRNKNQKGIETDPVKKNEKYYGFQSKYYTNSIKENKNDIIDSIKIAKQRNANLNIMYIYINLEFSESSKVGKKNPKYKDEIELIAKSEGIEIEWRVPSHLEYQLSLPKNEYIYDIFFNSGIERFEFEKEKNHIERMNKNIYSEKLKNDNILLLTGISYSGKTYLADELAKDFEDKELYQIKKTSKIEEIMNFFSNEAGRKKILFLEDPFGSVEAESGQENILKKVRDLIRKINENQKIIITSRSDILLEIMNKDKIEDCDFDEYKWNDLTEKNSVQIKELWELYYGDSFESIEVYENISNELNKTTKNFQFGHIKNISCKIKTLKELQNKNLEEIIDTALIDSEAIKNIIEKRGSLSRTFFITLGLSCNTYKSVSLTKLKNLLNNSKIVDYQEKLDIFLNKSENNNIDWNDDYDKEFEYLEKRGLIKVYNEEIKFSHPIYHYASYLLLKKLYLKTLEDKKSLLKILEKNLYFPFSNINICTLDFIEKLYKKTSCQNLKLLMLDGLEDIFPSVKEKIETFFSHNLCNLSSEEQFDFINKSLISKKIKWDKIKGFYYFNSKENLKNFTKWSVLSQISEDEKFDLKTLKDIDNDLLKYEESFIKNELIKIIFNKYAWKLNNIDKYLKNNEHPKYVYNLFISSILNWNNYSLEFKKQITSYLMNSLNNILLLIQISLFFTNFFKMIYLNLKYNEKDIKELWKIWYKIWKVFFYNFPFNNLRLPLYETDINTSEKIKFIEFNLVENAKFSLEFIKEEDEVVEFCEKWFIWAENFDLPNKDIYYERLEKLKGSFLKEFQYEFGIVEYLLQGINKKNKNREELFHRIISTKKTMLSLINLFISINHWDYLSENEQRIILKFLKSDRKDIKWIKAISLNVEKIPNEVQKEILGKNINEKNFVEFTDILIEKGILEECLNIYCGYSQPLWWMGYHHQNPKLWNNIILEVLKRNEVSKSYEIALRGFIDFIFLQDKDQDILSFDKLLKLIFDKKNQLFFNEILIFIIYKRYNKNKRINFYSIELLSFVLNEFLKYIKIKNKKEYKKYLYELIESEVINRIETFGIINIFDKKILRDIKIKKFFRKFILKNLKKEMSTIQLEFYKLKNWTN